MKGYKEGSTYNMEYSVFRTIVHPFKLDPRALQSLF